MKKLLQRIQPLIDAVDLNDMSPKLTAGTISIEKKTGFTTGDYAKRLLVLNAKELITDDEYFVLIRYHLREAPSAGTYLQ